MVQEKKSIQWQQIAIWTRLAMMLYVVAKFVVVILFAAAFAHNTAQYARGEQAVQYAAVTIMGSVYIIVSTEWIGMVIKAKSLGKNQSLIIRLRTVVITSLVVLGSGNLSSGMMASFGIGFPYTQYVATVLVTILLAGTMILILILMIRTSLWFRTIDRSDDTIKTDSAYLLLKTKTTILYIATTYMALTILLTTMTSGFANDLPAVIMFRKWLGCATESVALLLLWIFIRNEKHKSTVISSREITTATPDRTSTENSKKLNHK